MVANEQDSKGRPLRLLVIDDDDVDRMALQRTLKASDVTATLQEATTVAAGFEAAEKDSYDCILLDYQLPDGDGLALLRRLRAANIETPVVVMTGHGDEQLAVDILHAGASDYLPKNKLNPETLTHTLHNVTRMFQLESQRKTTQNQLAETSAHLQYLVDNSPAIIYSAVPSGDFTITFVSGNLYEVLGYQPRDMLNEMNFWFEHIHPEDQADLIQRLPRLLAKGGQQSHDYRFRHRDGHYLWMHDTLRMVYDEAGTPLELLGSLLDITERKSMEEAMRREKEEQRALIRELQEARDQLLQNEKMAAIGQLAAGVAHEINNPIGYINSNLGTLQRYTDDLIELVEHYQAMEGVVETSQPEAVKQSRALREKIDFEYIKEDLPDLVRESQEGAERVRRIVQDLKEFSHVDEAEWQWADLHQGLESTLNIVHNELKYKAEIHREYGELPQVECLASQVNQVFMNLLVNAAHAIEKSGTITLRSGCDEHEVWLEIGDSGKGIPADKLSHIFEPFYTTKPVGIGTGLGLSLSYSIIKKHHGRIDVESEVGKGSRFTIRLPIKHPDKRAETDGSALQEGDKP